jgi:5-carboxymethyl-2-hydroxymuconate isomerase
MPHIIVEYSANLLPTLDINPLIEDLHSCLNGLYNVTQDRLKTRAIRLDDYLIGTHGKSGKMVHVTLKLMTGRPIAARQEMGQILAAVTQKYIPVDTALTVEIVELDKETYFA